MVWYMYECNENYMEWYMLSLYLIYITSVLPIILPLKWFYSQIPFYTKYFVLSYSIDVVSSLSYCIYVTLVSSPFATRVSLHTWGPFY